MSAECGQGLLAKGPVQLGGGAEEGSLGMGWGLGPQVWRNRL